MFYIYKITNTINNKVYIGKTCRSIEKRWIEHCSRSKNLQDSFYLHNAIRKYGIENFKIEKIDNTDDIEELNQKEKQYITFFNANDKQYGYNLTIGGEGRTLYDYSFINELWNNGYAVKDIIKLLQCDKSVVTRALETNPQYTYSLSLQRSNANKKSINQYDKDKKLIKTFPSITAAAKELNCSEATISKCLKNKKYSALGYFWTYENEQLPNNVTIINKFSKRSVMQYDLNDNFIQQFESAAEAAKEVHPNSNINSSSNSILQVCKGNRKTAYGFKWKYK